MKRIYYSTFSGNLFSTLVLFLPVNYGRNRSLSNLPQVLNGLSRLYTSLVWESTVLLALCSEDTLPPGCEFGKADMDKLLPQGDRHHSMRSKSFCKIWPTTPGVILTFSVSRIFFDPMPSFIF
jgi:hypothetical protein